MRIFPFFHNLAILFSEIVIFMINWNKTSCRPIRSVIIVVINKSRSIAIVKKLIKAGQGRQYTTEVFWYSSLGFDLKKDSVCFRKRFSRP